MEYPQEDLRVRKTKAAIRNAFKDMICEMEYDQITIKELAYRAQINRKTLSLLFTVPLPPSYTVSGPKMAKNFRWMN